MCVYVSLNFYRSATGLAELWHFWKVNFRLYSRLFYYYYLCVEYEKRKAGCIFVCSVCHVLYGISRSLFYGERATRDSILFLLWRVENKNKKHKYPRRIRLKWNRIFIYFFTTRRWLKHGGSFSFQTMSRAYCRRTEMLKLMHWTKKIHIPIQQ